MINQVSLATSKEFKMYDLYHGPSTQQNSWKVLLHLQILSCPL